MNGAKNLKFSKPGGLAVRYFSSLVLQIFFDFIRKVVCEVSENMKLCLVGEGGPSQLTFILANTPSGLENLIINGPDTLNWCMVSEFRDKITVEMLYLTPI